MKPDHVPRISVVVPTADRPDLLSRALASVFAQTFADFEVIVVDDGTATRAEKVLAGFTDPRLRVITHGINHGAGAARNTGIRAARAPFIAFLEEGDEWLPEKLARQYASIAPSQDDVGFSVTNAMIVNVAEKRPTRFAEGEYHADDLTLASFRSFPLSTQMVKAAVFDAIGYFDESLPSHQEVDLAIRMARAYKVRALPDVLAHVDGGAPADESGRLLSRRIRGREILLLKHAELYDGRPDLLATHYFTLGLWCRDAGQREKARAYFAKASLLVKHPRYLVHWLGTYLPL